MQAPTEREHGPARHSDGMGMGMVVCVPRCCLRSLRFALTCQPARGRRDGSTSTCKRMPELSSAGYVAQCRLVRVRPPPPPCIPAACNHLAVRTDIQQGASSESCLAGYMTAPDRAGASRGVRGGGGQGGGDWSARWGLDASESSQEAYSVQHGNVCSQQRS